VSTPALHERWSDMYAREAEGKKRERANRSAKPSRGRDSNPRPPLYEDGLGCLDGSRLGQQSPAKSFWSCSTPPWRMRSSTSDRVGLAGSAVTSPVRSPKQRPRSLRSCFRRRPRRRGTAWWSPLGCPRNDRGIPVPPAPTVTAARSPASCGDRAVGRAEEAARSATRAAIASSARRPQARGSYARLSPKPPSTFRMPE
jgi:hypothetical protein